MNIKQFSEKTGVHINTIRNYQKAGILPDRRDPVNGYRVFTDEDVKTLKKAKKPAIRPVINSNEN